MKSKYTTYLLIALVALIWGLIVKRMFFSDDDSNSPVQTKHTKTDTSKNKHVDTLYLNYADPFLKKNFTKKTPSQQQPRQLTLPQQKKNTVQPVKDISLQYVGYVKEKKNGVISYLIKINGVQQIIRQNDNIDGLKLIKITADSLFFEKGDGKYSLHISH